jgi:hypothetical protein
MYDSIYIPGGKARPKYFGSDFSKMLPLHRLRLRNTGSGNRCQIKKDTNSQDASKNEGRKNAYFCSTPKCLRSICFLISFELRQVYAHSPHCQCLRPSSALKALIMERTWLSSTCSRSPAGSCFNGL